MHLNHNIASTAILFDLDGTLVDTAPDFIFVINKQRKRYGLAPLEDQLIRNTVSNGARALIQLSFNLQEGDENYADRHRELLDLYFEHLAYESTLFEGMDRLLDWLDANQLAWGVVTNKPRRFTDPLLERLDLTHRCQSIVCPDDVTHTKPDPEPLYLACKQLDKKPSDCIYVGDHLRDIEAGRNAGMMTIAAEYGYILNPNEVETWQADFVSKNASQMLDLLKKIYVQ